MGKGLRGLLFVLVASLATFGASDGWARDVPADAYCVLDRSPVLLEASLPEALQCQFDQDANGLDDAIERQLAQCFAPEFRFDSAENANRPDEPALLFSAFRLGNGQI